MHGFCMQKMIRLLLLLAFLATLAVLLRFFKSPTTENRFIRKHLWLICICFNLWKSAPRPSLIIAIK